MESGVLTPQNYPSPTHRLCRKRESKWLEPSLCDVMVDVALRPWRSIFHSLTAAALLRLLPLLRLLELQSVLVAALLWSFCWCRPDDACNFLLLMQLRLMILLLVAYQHIAERLYTPLLKSNYCLVHNLAEVWLLPSAHKMLLKGYSILLKSDYCLVHTKCCWRAIQSCWHPTTVWYTQSCRKAIQSWWAWSLEQKLNGLVTFCLHYNNQTGRTTHCITEGLFFTSNCWN